MKMTFCVLMAILGMGFWWSGPSSELTVEPILLTKAPLNSSPGTKVAMINFATVMEKYSRAIQIRQNIEDKMFPFKEKAKYIHDEMALVKERLGTDKSSGDDAKRLESRLRTYEADLDNLDIEIKAYLSSPRMKENTELIWKDINLGIDAVAKAYGFQMVLGHGVSKSLLPSSWRCPTLRCIDLGNTAPLYIHGTVDITEAVLSTIQPRWRPYVYTPRIPEASK